MIETLLNNVHLGRPDLVWVFVPVLVVFVLSVLRRRRPWTISLIRALTLGVLALALCDPVRQEIHPSIPSVPLLVQVQGERARQRTAGLGRRPLLEPGASLLSQRVETTQEAVNPPVRLTGEDHSEQEAAFVGRADGLRWCRRMWRVGTAGEPVDDRRQILSAKNLLSIQVGRRWSDLAIDHRQGVTQPRKLLPTP